jgi:glucoamylase
VQLRDRDGEVIQASALVSMDFSYLVRQGLRSAQDPRIQDTIAVVDRMLYGDRWEGVDYRVALGHADQQRALSSFG